MEDVHSNLSRIARSLLSSSKWTSLSHKLTNIEQGTLARTFRNTKLSLQH